MTEAQARLVAMQWFDNHPAAVPLILESFHGATEERRSRSLHALEALDPEKTPTAGPFDGVARAIADLLIEGLIYETDRTTRVSVAKLLAHVSAQAEKLYKRREAAA